MGKFKRFFLYLVLISIIIVLISFIIHLGADKSDNIKLVFDVVRDFLFALPLTASLAIFWPLVIVGKKEAEQGESRSTVSFFTILFIFLVAAVSILFQEVLTPYLYNMSLYKTQLVKNGIKTFPRIKDRTGANFSLSEFNYVKYMEEKDNIAFAMGNSYIYFGKMFNGNGCYYVINLRILTYNSKMMLDNIISADAAKIYEDEIMAVSPYYFTFSGNQYLGGRQLYGVKKIPLLYSADGIFNLSSEADGKMASLIDVFVNNDYIYSSKINFFHLGNIIFNKISYYIILAFMLILASSLGTAMRNKRLTKKEYTQVVAFLIVSFVITCIVYETMVSIVNMIYGMLI